MSFARLSSKLTLVFLASLLFSCADPNKNKTTITNDVVTVVYGFDGTGKNLKHGAKTNVYQFLKSHRTSDRRVENVYAGGVGSSASGLLGILNIPGKVTGLGGRAIIDGMYDQLVKNFKKGQKGVVIVGFSRGAALSREFAHVILERGDPINYKKGNKPQGKAPDITFMALFDTVYSFDLPVGRNDISYRKSIASNVRAVAHATAKLEKRNTFDLWSIHLNEKNLNRTTGSIEKGNYRAEREFNGGHDDVGGAEEFNYYGYNPLRWIIAEGKKTGVRLVMPDKAHFKKKKGQKPRGHGLGKRQIYFPNPDHEVAIKLPEGKLPAVKIGKAKNGCEGKQIYLSGGSCYSCPRGYRRYSPTRKMTHPKACTKRGLGTNTVRASYKWEFNGCLKDQFKHKGYCKKCPQGATRLHVAGLDSGYCIR